MELQQFTSIDLFSKDGRNHVTNLKHNSERFRLCNKLRSFPFYRNTEYPIRPYLLTCRATDTPYHAEQKPHPQILKVRCLIYNQVTQRLLLKCETFQESTEWAHKGQIREREQHLTNWLSEGENSRNVFVYERGDRFPEREENSIAVKAVLLRWWDGTITINMQFTSKILCWFNRQGYQIRLKLTGCNQINMDDKVLYSLFFRCWLPSKVSFFQ